MGVRAGFGATAPVVPGQTSHCDLTVENTGDTEETIRVELLGELEAWAWTTPARATVAPGASAVMRVTVKLPRSTHPPAGPLAIAARVIRSGAPAAPVDVAGTLDVAGFTDVFAHVDPPVSRGRTAGRHTLTVENRGNTRLSATVAAEGEGVSATVAPARIELNPGTSTVAHVVVKARKARLRGSTSTSAFEVVVAPDGPGRAGRAEGLVEQAPVGVAGRVAVGVLSLAVLGVGVGATVSGSGGGRTEDSGDDQQPELEQAVTVAPRAPSACPALDHISPDANGQIREGVQPRSDYTFLFVGRQECRPVGFNPCQPVRYVVNRGQASDADMADLEQALAKLAAATGLEFQYVGPTDEDPRILPSPRREVDGSLSWPPVVIGWARLGTGDQLRPRTDRRADPDVVVSGGGTPVVVRDVIVTGTLILNLDAVTDTDTRKRVPNGFGPGVNWGRIILHELAHVIGLGHVESRTSIMNEDLTRQTISSSEWGIGDLAGLKQLGRENGCLTVPPVPAGSAPPR